MEYAAYQESDEQYVPSIVKMCIWMEVSRSGFYEWRNAPESATAKRRGILALYVQKSFDDSDGTYGYRRVHTDLVAWGVPAGPELVRSVMRELGLEPCQPRPWRLSLTEGDGQEHDIPDLVNRDFTADVPGEKMVGDITYISTLRPCGKNSRPYSCSGIRARSNRSSTGPIPSPNQPQPTAGSCATRTPARSCSYPDRPQAAGTGGRSISGIMWVIFDHLRPSGHIMPDHVGDRGAARLDLGASRSPTYQPEECASASGRSTLIRWRRNTIRAGRKALRRSVALVNTRSTVFL